jgi:pyrimidine-nucleoside phosphorylase
LIERKKNGFELEATDIRQLIEGYTAGTVADYQMSALAMAIYFRGMTPAETTALTIAMANSGDTADLSSIDGIKVDKHSTGGVGDKTTLIVGPLAAACGVPVAKMSGRGLGHTGGTIDKLESIPGYQAVLTMEQFIAQVNRIGLAVIGQSGNIAPADKKLYALRDVTATVDSIPMIASSVMSKKIAAGADCIVLDVKVGNGAFMKTLDDATQLAEQMVAIGRGAGRQTVALVTGMDEPLGHAIGNALEVAEAIETLRGAGPADLTELCLTLAAYMVYLGQQSPSLAAARKRAEEALASGAALAKFGAFLAAQGADARVIDDPWQVLPAAPGQVNVLSTQTGYVAQIAAEELGLSAMILGGGRKTKDDTIDYSVGVSLQKKVGDYVEAGDVLATLHVSIAATGVETAEQMVQDAFQLSTEKPAKVQHIRKIVE